MDNIEEARLKAALVAKIVREEATNNLKSYEPDKERLRNNPLFDVARAWWKFPDGKKAIKNAVSSEFTKITVNYDDVGNPLEY